MTGEGRSIQLSRAMFGSMVVTSLVHAGGIRQLMVGQLGVDVLEVRSATAVTGRSYREGLAADEGEQHSSKWVAARSYGLVRSGGDNMQPGVRGRPVAASATRSRPTSLPAAVRRT